MFKSHPKSSLILITKIHKEINLIWTLFIIYLDIQKQLFLKMKNFIHLILIAIIYLHFQHCQTALALLVQIEC